MLAEVKSVDGALQTHTEIPQWKLGISTVLQIKARTNRSSLQGHGPGQDLEDESPWVPSQANFDPWDKGGASE